MAQKKWSSEEGKIKYLLKLLSGILFLILLSLSIGLSIKAENTEGNGWILWLNVFNPIVQNIVAVLLVYLIVSLFLEIKGLSPTQMLKNEISEGIIDQILQNQILPTSSFFSSKYELTKQNIESAEKAFFLGITLTEVLEENYDSLLNLIQQKKIVRLLIAEPSEAVIDQWTQMSTDQEDPEIYQHYFWNALGYIKKLYRQNTGSLEVRLVPFIPSFGIAIIEQKNIQEIWVQIFPQPLKNNHSKYFKVSKNRDPSLYEYYQIQYEDVWNKAKPLYEKNIDSFSDIEITRQRQLFMKDFFYRLTPVASEWLNWKTHIKEDKEPVDNFNQFIFDKLIQEYLELHIPEIKRKRIPTTSDRYVHLVKEISEYVYSKIDKNKQEVFRLQFTGMLPEEFYNGPQIEYTKINSTPIFFCHMWEGYDDLYSFDQDIRKFSFKRCVLVKEDRITNPKYSALHSLNDLREHKHLYFLSKNPIGVNSLDDPKFKGVSSRLLRYCKQQVRSTDKRTETEIEMDYIKKVINSESYKYYPIIKSEKSENSEVFNQDNLLHRYINEFHNNIEDALYFVLNDDNISLFEKINKTLNVFKEGKVPEITLFAIIDKSTNDFPKFIFGVKGSYTLYTRAMEIEFFSHKQLSVLFNSIKPIFDNIPDEKGSVPSSPNQIIELLKS